MWIQQEVHEPEKWGLYMTLTRNHVKLNRFEVLESYDLTWLQNYKAAKYGIIVG